MRSEDASGEARGQEVPSWLRLGFIYSHECIKLVFGLAWVAHMVRLGVEGNPRQWGWSKHGLSMGFHLFLFLRSEERRVGKEC